MMKIALAVAAAATVLTTAPLVTPGKAQSVKMAQGVDVQVGRDRDDRYDRDRRRRYDSDTTVGVGPGGVTIGPRQRCRMETTTVERDEHAQGAPLRLKGEQKRITFKGFNDPETNATGLTGSRLICSQRAELST